MGKRNKAPTLREERAASWTFSIEGYLKKLQSKSMVYKLLYARTAQKLAKKGKGLAITNVITTATAGTTLLANIPYSETAVTIITGLVLYVDSIMIGISEFLNYTSQADDHRTAETDFDDLVNIIQRQLILEPEERQHAKDFMVWVDREFKMKFEKSPLISPRMIKKMEKEYGSKLNPELMDANQLNEPSDPIPETLPDQEEYKEKKPKKRDLQQSDEETFSEEKPKRTRKRTKKNKPLPSTTIFEDSKADAQIDGWQDMRMVWEMDRYQQ